MEDNNREKGEVEANLQSLWLPKMLSLGDILFLAKTLRIFLVFSWKLFSTSKNFKRIRRFEPVTS
jgi:hypothetical protein